MNARRLWALMLVLAASHATCAAQLVAKSLRVWGGAVAAIELRTAAGDDVARNGTATASGNIEGSYLTIDGRVSTVWYSPWGSTDPWVMVVLREPTVLRSIAIFPEQNNPGNVLRMELLGPSNVTLLQSGCTSAIEGGTFWVWRLDVPLQVSLTATPTATPSPTRSAVTMSPTSSPLPTELPYAWQPDDAASVELWLRLDELVAQGNAQLTAGSWPTAVPAGAAFTLSTTAPLLSTAMSLNGFTPVSFTTSSYASYPDLNYAGVGSYTLAYLAIVTGASRRVLTGIGNNYLMGWWNGHGNCAYGEGWSSPCDTQPALPGWTLYVLTAADGRYTLHRNGVLVGNTTGAFQGPIGIAFNTGRYIEPSDFSLTELIMLRRAVEADERQRMEAYFMHKHGLQTLLSRDNPYAQAPPYSRSRSCSATASFTATLSTGATPSPTGTPPVTQSSTASQTITPSVTPSRSTTSSATTSPARRVACPGCSVAYFPPGVFSYVNLTAPPYAGADFLELHMWGAASGSIYGGGSIGGFVTGLLPISAALRAPTPLLRIIVGTSTSTPSTATGSGGSFSKLTPPCVWCTNGGGRSAVQTLGQSPNGDGWVDLVTVGGGGGGTGFVENLSGLANDPCSIDAAAVPCARGIWLQGSSFIPSGSNYGGNGGGGGWCGGVGNNDIYGFGGHGTSNTNALQCAWEAPPVFGRHDIGYGTVADPQHAFTSSPYYIPGTAFPPGWGDGQPGNVAVVALTARQAEPLLATCGWYATPGPTTCSASPLATATSTATYSPTASRTPTRSASSTAIPATPSRSVGLSPSTTATPTQSARSDSASQSISPTLTPSRTASVSNTATPTDTAMPTMTATQSSNWRQACAPRSTWASLAAGGFHACAVTDTTTLTCWGSATFGAETPPQNQADIASVAAGELHSCALTHTGAVSCWGYSGNGQLYTAAGGVRQVVAAARYTCVLLLDGAVDCVGWTPFQIPLPSMNASYLAAGGSFLCALMQTDNTLQCWGANDYWSGYGYLSSPVVAECIVALSAGANHACLLTASGAVKCWGREVSGNLAPYFGIVSVSAGDSHTCVVDSSGRVQCRGDNTFGQASVPAMLPRASQVSCGWFHTCAVVAASSGSGVVCWGRNSDAYNLDAVSNQAAAPAAVSGGVGFPTRTPSSTQSATVTPSSTASRTVTPSNTATPTASSTVTGTASSTQTGTASRTQTGTASATLTGTPSQTATRTASSTQSGTPSDTNTGTPSATATGTASSTQSGTSSGSSTGTPSATATGTGTSTGTPSGTATGTPSPTATGTPSSTQSGTPTSTPSPTATVTASSTQSGTPSGTTTGTPSPTATGTATPTRTGTATGTQTGTATPTPTGTSTRSATTTATRSATPSPTSPSGWITTAVMLDSLSPRSLAVAADGGVFIASPSRHAVYYASPAGAVAVLAGSASGMAGFAGDGGPAGLARLNSPSAVALDAPRGRLLVADSGNHRVRAVALSSRVITTIAGTGAGVSTGSGGPATSAAFWWPSGLAVDPAGWVYVAEGKSHTVRRIAPGTGVVSPRAGTPGGVGYGGDGGPATAGRLNTPGQLAYDAVRSRLLIADSGNYAVRAVAANGTLSTLAGAGYKRVPGLTPDGAPAHGAALTRVLGVAVDGAGGVAFSDSGYGTADANGGNSCVRTVTPGGALRTLAGRCGVSPHPFTDNAPATSVLLDEPAGLAYGGPGGGTLYVADYGHGAVRRVAFAAVTPTRTPTRSRKAKRV